MSEGTLHLLRHGEPELSGRLLGRTDCPSTPGGIEICVRQTAGIAVDRIISSPLRRALAAAERIAAGRKGTPLVDPRWLELDFGRWDGLSTAELTRTDATALGAFWADPDANPPPDGERWLELRARVAQALDAIVGPALVVTHGGPMRAALSVLCGLDQRQSWCVDLPCGALLSLRRHEGGAQIVGLKLP